MAVNEAGQLKEGGMVARPDSATAGRATALAGEVAPDQKPLHQRPETPEFWCHRFNGGVTPWDLGGVPSLFADFARRQTAPLRTLVPGCGAGWEAGALDAHGWPTTALDFSPAAIEQAQRNHPEFGGELVCADFFAYEPAQPFDLIYERAFLCAIPRKLWPGYAPTAARLLRPGGELAGYFFLNAAALKGPPFGMARAELCALLEPAFKLVEECASPDGIGPFAGHEVWMRWQRR